MKKNSSILYTFEDEEGHIKIVDLDYFNRSALSETITGYLDIDLIDENETINVPILKGYRHPYDWCVTDEIGTEHYIYYEELV